MKQPTPMLLYYRDFIVHYSINNTSHSTGALGSIGVVVNGGIRIMQTPNPTPTPPSSTDYRAGAHRALFMVNSVSLIYSICDEFHPIYHN
jgi:hypothetical protein